jgi:hypothetical protein
MSSEYQIYSKQKYSPYDFSLETFTTGGQKYPYREAVNLKNKLKNMCSGFEFKVKKVI